MSGSDLNDLVRRLEEVTSRLESVASKGGGAVSDEGIGQSIGQIIRRLQTVGGQSQGGDTAKVEGFDAVLNGVVAEFITLSNEIGGDVATQVAMVNTAFQAQRDFIVQVSQCKVPKPEVLQSMLKPTADAIGAVQEFREKNRGSKQFNHLSAVSEGIPVMGWVTVAPKPGNYIKEMCDSAQFYTNRVIKDFKGNDERQVQWARAFTKIFTTLKDYVQDEHTTGVSWNPAGRDATGPAASKAPAKGGPPPPPPPPAIVPPAAGAAGGTDDDKGRAALFSALNKGEGITSGLKKVTSDMQTHKNPALRHQSPTPYKGPTPYKAPSGGPTSPVFAPGDKKVPPPVAKKPHPPKLELNGSKWLVEYQEGNKNIVIETTALKQTVYIYKCNNCTIQVKGKINSITADGCKKTGIALDSLVSSLDIINCQSVQAQVMEKIPTISIDKTDGAQIYLSKESLECTIVTAKSSAMNVLVPTDTGEFSEHPIAEQFKTFWDGKKLKTEVSEIIG
ncbi:adenylyl cyclase-associated protein 1-like isoform X2 [Glandiceps talaboti]